MLWSGTLLVLLMPNSVQKKACYSAYYIRKSTKPLSSHREFVFDLHHNFGQEYYVYPVSIRLITFAIIFDEPCTGLWVFKLAKVTAKGQNQLLTIKKKFKSKYPTCLHSQTKLVGWECSQHNYIFCN